MSHLTQNSDARIETYIQSAYQLVEGDYSIQIPIDGEDQVAELGQALELLAISLESQYMEIQQLDNITADINEGLMLSEIMNRIYEAFWQIIPYDRIGLSLVEGDTVTAHWARSESEQVKIQSGYSALLAGSSLEHIMNTGQPRIINDMVAYIEQKPESASTRRILAEGVMSSLTCPLKMNGVPVGFLFFSSFQPNTYAQLHVDIFLRIANQVSVILEKGKLVSELAKQKATIEAQNEKLKTLYEIKNKFLGMISHDLRSPLSTIQMGLDIMSMPEMMLTDEESQEIKRDMQHQAQHMLFLIDDLLSVTEVEAGELKLRYEMLKLPDYLDEIVQRQNQMAGNKGTTITVTHCPVKQVYADPMRLRQVLDNLISNAVKYSPPNSQITVASFGENNAWGVSVTDQGPGITLEDRPKLFKQYQRLSARPTGGEKSTGLGLAISRRIIEAHQGQIGVDSIPGDGATFWFRIPTDLEQS